MKKTSIILILLVINSVVLRLNAQSSEIDSLENLLLQHQKKDTIRINILNETAYKLYSIDFEKTIKYAKEAEKLAHHLNFVKGEAESLRLIGISSLMKGNYPKALEYYHESLKLSEEIGNKQGIAKVLQKYYII